MIGRGALPAATVDWSHGPPALGVLPRSVNRNKLPGWINATIDAIADRPASPIGRLAARRLGRPAPRGSVAVTQFDDRPRRVLIAPVNYSAQGRAWARALERADPSISARSMAIDVPGGFSFDADLIVPVATYHNDPDWQRRQLAAALGATHVLIEAAEPPLGRMFGRNVASQMNALRDGGADVAFLGHGTDIRLPSRHVARTRWSYYADPTIYAPRAETLAARNIRLLRESGRPLFVSTPDLLSDLPEATWCPVVVDPERWSTTRVPRSGPLRVVHAPSVGPVKGTALISPILERLAAEGVIRLELVQGVPSSEMPAVFARNDVMIDQFRTGSYGVAACEAMAAGCVVVGHVLEDVRDIVSTTRAELPIVEGTPLTLERVLRSLADEEIVHRGAAGVAFVSDLHDGRRSAEVLIGDWVGPTRDGEGGHG
jgi:hypothetical protein